jgi:hypothetical protein
MNSKPFSLNSSDFAKGGVVVVIAAVLAGLQQMLTAHGLDFQNYDWGWIANCAVIAIVAYLTKNFSSNEAGQVMTPVGRIG